MPASKHRVAVVLGSFALVAVGCDLVKKAGDADAASPASTVAPVATSAATTAAPNTPAPPETSPPLGGGAVPPPTAVAPKLAAADGGKLVDAGAVADAGALADGGRIPTPIPTLTVPTIPGFDAGGWKPPPGLPSTFPSTLPLPGFPPPTKK